MVDGNNDIDVQSFYSKLKLWNEKYISLYSCICLPGQYIILQVLKVIKSEENAILQTISLPSK